MLPNKTALQAFSLAVKNLKTKMDTLYPEGTELVYDGPVNDEKYFTAPIKIAWLLKEAHGDEGWDYDKFFADQSDLHHFLSTMGSRQMWQRICFASYGILNGCQPYNDLDDWTDTTEIAQAIFQVALVNIKKLPGKSESNGGEIGRSYQANKSLLQEQLELLNPDVIIGGGALKYYLDMFDLSEPAGYTKTFNRTYYLKEDKVYIDAYHPAYVCYPEPYHDDIVMAVKHWHEQKQEQPTCV